MKKHYKTVVCLVAVVAALLWVSQPATGQEVPTVKKERNHIRSGNKLYNAKRYAEAEVEYRKAIEANPQSGLGQFNLATALMRQGSATSKSDDKNNPMTQAEGILQNLVKSTPSRDLQAKAYYDLGNIAFGRQQYDQAVEHYKNALRRNPDDDQARDNLRLAQLKLKQQQQNQDKQNQDQDKKDQNKDQQDKQNQDKQNQDRQNQDKQNQDKQNQDKQNQDKQNQDKQNQQQGGMSQQNVEQVLKAMQDQERATQQKVSAEQARQQRAERARTNRKW